jgi:hypothetical protein
MLNFVLVHGAWYGGWCYRYTANELRGRGHVVVTPTLTGVGERFHASSEAITLETHIRDVVGCISEESIVGAPSTCINVCAEGTTSAMCKTLGLASTFRHPCQG